MGNLIITNARIQEAKEFLIEEIDFVSFYKDMIDPNVDFERKKLQLCPLPLHQEKTGSFQYFQNTNTFYCYGCQSHGTVVDLYHKLQLGDNPTQKYVASLFGLAKEYNLDIRPFFTPATQETTSPEKAQAANDLKRLYARHKPINAIHELKDNKETSLPLKVLIAEIEQNIKTLPFDQKVSLFALLDASYMLTRDATDEEKLTILKKIKHKVDSSERWLHSNE